MLPLSVRLEIYAGVSILFGVGCVGAYFKGHSDATDAIQQKQLADNAKTMTAYQSTARERDTADELSRGKALAFVDDISKKMEAVNAKLSKLPAVVVDARGCNTLTDAAGVQWNNVELVPTGQTIDPPGDAVGPVPAAAVPRAR